MNKIYTLILISLFFTTTSFAKQIENQRKSTTLLSLPNTNNFEELVEFNRYLLQQVNRLNTVLNAPAKSAAFKQKLDSTVSNNGFPIVKEEFVYNNLGKCTLYTKKKKFFDEDKWSIETKHEYSFNTAGFETLVSIWDTDPTTGTLVNKSKTETTYNSNNQETSIIEWNNDNSSKVLTRVSKMDITYNSNGKGVMISSEWKTATSSWVEIVKMEWQYANQRITKIETFNKSAQSTWVLFSSTTHNYDAKGNITESITQTFDNLLQKLVNLMKMETSYYPSNLEKTQIQYMWDATSTAWDKYSQLSFEYNAKGQTSKTSTYLKNFITGVLEIIKTEEISFDSNSNPTSLIISLADELGILKQYGKETYTFSTAQKYNTLILPSSVLMFDDYEYYMNGRLDKTIEYTNEGSAWSEVRTTNYYYSTSSITVGISKIENGVKVFPNPTTDFLHIEAGTNERIEYSLFDITGKNILSGSVNGSAQLSLKNRNRGIYFIDVKIENSVSKRMKIVKE